jgi:hypothetical protein
VKNNGSWKLKQETHEIRQFHRIWVNSSIRSVRFAYLISQQVRTCLVCIMCVCARASVKQTWNAKWAIQLQLTVTWLYTRVSWVSVELTEFAAYNSREALELHPPTTTLSDPLYYPLFHILLLSITHTTHTHTHTHTHILWPSLSWPSASAL